MSCALSTIRKWCSLGMLQCIVVACAPADRNETDADTRTDTGRQLLAQHQCGSCHVIPGVPDARGQVAVSLQSFGRRSYIAGHIPNTDENLARWIVDPPALVPGTAMPALGVSPDDAQAMVAYLRSLR